MAVNGEAEHLNWWSDHLKDLTVSPLTRDYPEVVPEDAPKRAIEAVESLDAGSSTSDALRKLSVSTSATNVVLAALVILTARLTGDEDISVGANAARSGLPFVLRLSTASAEPFSTLLQRVSEAVEAGKEKAIHLDEISAHLKEPVLFRFAGFHSSIDEAIPGVTVRTTDLLIKYTVTEEGRLHLASRYNQRLFSSGRIAGILAQLATLIANAGRDPKAACGAIDFCTPEQESLRPDPTSNLEWSSFKGAIHDIFAANAARHPDRICVVETSSDDKPERRFTYRQINEASNLLAHHLVKSGLQIGDVVMIYSYRGVDLMVAVMGILKAGGTFSVLDPAYPPDRQNIYLEVSKPRALVIIERATKEAGQLDQKVRNFISENLNLRTEVPALYLHDSGVLTGGRVGGQDIFDPVQELKSQGTGVIVGPDSTPTLSFTSGSEGKPKGVRGRHYSLAFYFDWMAKTFKLSENDKFTMLSGIAHDPIQRDMFTPLFLGAQLLVPAKDDIQNERLAEWMAAHGATVTHLTPAMGQILVGGAMATFDKLHHAFFVGDVLIKRDCRSLQNLAPNVNIVNMYGTTETQRAVSYYEIPSRTQHEGFLDGMKDVIPAGRGMYNVQMLVVNRYDTTKLCAVGEIGEIYVRASGLAEEYLGTPDLTAKKFVKNWFPGHGKGVEADKAHFESLKDQTWADSKLYYGPRDRLYRSGDLGRYTPTGDVECSGRADDQVKIRGFRIELGEIDTHLSQHPLIRENVTLVRRDKFEEQTLVSYIVPQIKTWLSFLRERGQEDQQDDGTLVGRFERFRLLQQDVIEHLKTKLPAYAVPSIVVPMRAMPLNPNGKVDKPKLPFPDTAMLSASRRRRSSMLAQLSESESTLAGVWAKLVPGLIPKTVKPEESFFDIGGDSMKAQQLAYMIRRNIGANIPISKIYSKPTLKEMAAGVERLMSAESLQGQQDEEEVKAAEPEVEYSKEVPELAKLLPEEFEKASGAENPIVFLTGATGFLGSYVLSDLLDRTSPAVAKVVLLVRAKDAETALNRVRATCSAYGVWQDAWASRVHCVTGSLGPDRFGLSSEDYKLAADADVVIHNGAQVHWINTYSMLKAPNVLGTIEALRLCARPNKPKKFCFVSSTSVLDTDHFVSKSERIIAAGGEGISEEDDLSGSATGLGTGYGQTKWVSEALCRLAGRRGLNGSVVRPGYVLGDSTTGVTNTDDFLIRMLKGCIQLGSRPNINNTVNMVPVNHVARTVVACAFHPPSSGGVNVAQITGHPRLRFNQFLAALQTYGYSAKLIDYVPWASMLEHYVASTKDPKDTFALMPLFTFVANDLPSNTRAPELDDANAEAALYVDREWTGEDVSAGAGVTKNTVGMYLAYLVQTGFLPPPQREKVEDSEVPVKRLPRVVVSDAQRRALGQVGGRGGLA
jgi:L-2-aminoadipate reductase